MHKHERNWSIKAIVEPRTASNNSHRTRTMQFSDLKPGSIIYEGPGTESAKQLKLAYAQNGGKNVKVFTRETDGAGNEYFDYLYLDGDGRERCDLEPDEETRSYVRNWYDDRTFHPGYYPRDSSSVKLSCPAPAKSAFNADGTFHASIQNLLDRIDRMNLRFTAKQIINEEVLKVYYYAGLDIVWQNLHFQIGNLLCMKPDIPVNEARDFLRIHLEGRLMDSKHHLHHSDCMSGLIALKGMDNVPFPEKIEDVFERKTLMGQSMWVRKLTPCTSPASSPKTKLSVKKTIVKPKSIEIPKCKNCGKLAKKLVVKKDGPNKGREFFGCDWKCNFFKWADK